MTSQHLAVRRRTGSAAGLRPARVALLLEVEYRRARRDLRLDGPEVRSLSPRG